MGQIWLLMSCNIDTNYKGIPFGWKGIVWKNILGGWALYCSLNWRYNLKIPPDETINNNNKSKIQLEGRKHFSWCTRVRQELSLTSKGSLSHLSLINKESLAKGTFMIIEPWFYPMQMKYVSKIKVWFNLVAESLKCIN